MTNRNNTHGAPPIGYFSNPDEAAKIKIIQKLKKDCRDIMGKKKLFQFYPVANYYMMKPSTSIVVDGFKINLRYSSQFDTPFVDEQKTNEAVRVEMVNLSLEDPAPISTDEMCKLMFLFLHPSNHDNLDKSNSLLMENSTTFYLEDLEKEAEEMLERYDLLDEATALCREGDEDDLAAAYYVVSGENTDDMTVRMLRSSLRSLCDTMAEDVIDAFSDKKTKVKFTFRSAINMGNVYETKDGTELKSAKTNNIILSIPSGADMEDEFATWCTENDKGKQFFDSLKEDLNK